MEEDLEIAIKVVIVGNGAVGKSSMIQRYCKGIFTKDYKKTIGVDFLEKEIELDGEEIRLMLWDTAGQEEFDSITRAYYRGAQACVLAFSITDRASFEAIDSWKKKVEVEVGEIPMVLVQNKLDLIDEACVSEEDCELLAQRLKMELFKTSVKDNLNIDSVFEYLAETYLSHMRLQEEEISKQTSIGPGLLSGTSLNQYIGSRSDGYTNHVAQLNVTELVTVRENGKSSSSTHKINRGNGNSGKKKDKCLLL
ncbi:RAB23 [Bugula neritina]|uniref:RAB23 n=1 Tax=Bugula neritina TaxID=10212 RepID=A0A7J7JH49_BUGNE|nr:RAB23 [Bugula neritina]